MHSRWQLTLNLILSGSWMVRPSLSFFILWWWCECRKISVHYRSKFCSFDRFPKEGADPGRALYPASSSGVAPYKRQRVDPDTRFKPDTRSAKTARHCEPKRNQRKVAANSNYFLLTESGFGQSDLVQLSHCAVLPHAH